MAAQTEIVTIAENSDQWFPTNIITGSGTITSVGTAVTGTGTKFLKELKVGWTIANGANTATIESIESDTALTLSGAFSGGNVTDVAYTVSALNGTIYTSEHFVIGTDTKFTTDLAIGNYIVTENNKIAKVRDIISDTRLVLDRPFPTGEIAEGSKESFTKIFNPFYERVEFTASGSACTYRSASMSAAVTIYSTDEREFMDNGGNLEPFRLTTGGSSTYNVSLTTIN